MTPWLSNDRQLHAGEAEYAYQPSAGDEIRVSGNREMRVLAVIPVELAGEFVDRPLYGVLEVEPVYK